MDIKRQAILLSSVAILFLVFSGILMVTAEIGDDNSYINSGELPQGRRLRQGFLSTLTEEQRSEIMSKIQELKEAGATREEIKAEINAMLEEWGIEPPEFQGPSWLDDLTDEQKEIIEQKVQEMKESGATREEIRAEITAMLEEWGIEPPKCRGPRVNGIRQRMRHRIRRRVAAEDSES